jgi:hypothetical protein
VCRRKQLLFVCDVLCWSVRDDEDDVKVWREKSDEDLSGSNRNFEK